MAITCTVLLSACTDSATQRAIADLESRVRDLESQVSDLESRLDDACSAIDKVNKEVDTLESDLNSTLRGFFGSFSYRPGTC
jgi:peptidoglycan hydrolase CwlO-like protein